MAEKKESRKLERSFMSLEDVRRDAGLESRLEDKREDFKIVADYIQFIINW